MCVWPRTYYFAGRAWGHSSQIQESIKPTSHPISQLAGNVIQRSDAPIPVLVLGQLFLHRRMTPPDRLRLNR